MSYELTLPLWGINTKGLKAGILLAMCAPMLTQHPSQQAKRRINCRACGQTVRSERVLVWMSIHALDTAISRPGGLRPMGIARPLWVRPKGLPLMEPPPPDESSLRLSAHRHQLAHLVIQLSIIKARSFQTAGVSPSEHTTHPITVFCTCACSLSIPRPSHHSQSHAGHRSI